MKCAPVCGCSDVSAPGAALPLGAAPHVLPVWASAPCVAGAWVGCAQSAPPLVSPQSGQVVEVLSWAYRSHFQLAEQALVMVLCCSLQYGLIVFSPVIFLLFIIS